MQVNEYSNYTWKSLFLAYVLENHYTMSVDTTMKAYTLCHCITLVKAIIVVAQSPKLHKTLLC